MGFGPSANTLPIPFCLFAWNQKNCGNDWDQNIQLHLDPYEHQPSPPPSASEPPKRPPKGGKGDCCHACRKVKVVQHKWMCNKGIWRRGGGLITWQPADFLCTFWTYKALHLSSHAQPNYPLLPTSSQMETITCKLVRPLPILEHPPDM